MIKLVSDMIGRGKDILTVDKEKLSYPEMGPSTHRSGIRYVGSTYLLSKA